MNSGFAELFRELRHRGIDTGDAMWFGYRYDC